MPERNIAKLAQLEDLAKTLVSERESETTLRDQFRQRLAGMRESMESLQVRSDTLKNELIEQ